VESERELCADEERKRLVDLFERREAESAKLVLGHSIEDHQEQENFVSPISNADKLIG
jgi:hypothetical protein